MAGEVNKIKMEESWKRRLLKRIPKKALHVTAQEFLQGELASQQLIYPKGDEYFSAFNMTPFDNVKSGDTWAGSLPWAKSSSWFVFFLFAPKFRSHQVCKISIRS